MALVLTDAEKEYIGRVSETGQAKLAEIATSTPDGQPHVVPLRAGLNAAGEKVLVLGNSMAQSYKYRQVQKNPKVAVVWHSQEPGPPPTIKGIEIRGTAEIKQAPGDKDPHFEVTLTKAFSWGINESAPDSFEKKMGMDVSHMRRGEDRVAPDR